MKKLDSISEAQKRMLEIRGRGNSEFIAEHSFALACNIVDTLPFIGRKLDQAQPRAWPRSGVYTDDGVPMEETPQEIFELCELLASHICSGKDFDIFEIFHKIARLDRLIDFTHGTLIPSGRIH